MQKIILGVIGVVVALVAIVIFSHINNIPTLDENVKAKFSQVDNQYKRRADLVPNLVATVKGAH
ncbi:MAG: LemA family protein [Sulfurimonas sp.]